MSSSRNGRALALKANCERTTGSRPKPCSSRQARSIRTIDDDQSRNVSAGFCVPMPWTKTIPTRSGSPARALAGATGVAPAPGMGLRSVAWKASWLTLTEATLAFRAPRDVAAATGYDARMYLDALSFLEDERDAWRPYEALAKVPDERLDRPVEAAHGWSARDLIAHMVGWQQLALTI